MSSRTTTLIALLACACIACESYDPPPEVTLVVSQTGTWALDAPLELTFSEPIKSETLKISIWPFELDEEGEIATGVVPLVDSCTLGGDSCGDLGLTLGADASSAELDLSVLFADRQGEPYILEVHEGLTDSGGKVRITRSRFDFQVSPSSGSGPVVAELNSGVMLLVADRTEILPGVYLRLFVDIVIDSDTGDAWFAGTVAELDTASGAPPNTNDPEVMGLYENEKGWAISMTGKVTDLEPGKFYLETDPQTVTVMVHGLIWVQLQGFRFEATVTNGAEGDRDYGEGLLTADTILLGDPTDPDDLGEGAAALTMTGIFAEEIDPALPQLCEEDPCAEMTGYGGDCQLVEPWEKVPGCP